MFKIAGMDQLIYVAFQFTLSEKMIVIFADICRGCRVNTIPFGFRNVIGITGREFFIGNCNDFIRIKCDDTIDIFDFPRYGIGGGDFFN